MNKTTDIDTITEEVDTPDAGVTLKPQLAGHPLLPGENPADKEQLRIALMAEVAPTTAYQRRLAQQLVEYEWEIDRHRRLRDLSILGRYHERAKAVLTQRLPSTPFEICAEVGDA